ncbi:helix-turn-helix domain-containing protein [Halobacillus yeomjeoni]|uniref:Helix-turn-helix domain-containing protein n=1 Tax=Halobacillus yeomjeoni TaxID=311194 RepID=A0A931HT63_9BACI|nr:helix-turn-helix domain-containing protein [Halobacillus yeomjeoni]MBH0229104.1 helix-turn-helix domain-containing protein [Halobacillus yeomjeoni]
MRMNTYLLILAASILTGSWMVTSALNDTKAQTAVKEITLNHPPKDQQLMSPGELKQYLGIRDDQLAKILPKKDGDVVKSKLPYVKIGYEYYFPQKAVDKWLAETEAEVFQ